MTQRDDKITGGWIWTLLIVLMFTTIGACAAALLYLGERERADAAEQVELDSRSNVRTLERRLAAVSAEPRDNAAELFVQWDQDLRCIHAVMLTKLRGHNAIEVDIPNAAMCAPEGTAVLQPTWEMRGIDQGWRGGVGYPRPDPSYSRVVGGDFAGGVQ